MKKNKPIKRLPFGIYYWSVVGLAIAGLLDSVYLAISHYRQYTDIGYSSFCAISKAINCDTVSQSPSAIMFGMPVAVWGVVGYLFFLALLGFARRHDTRPTGLWPLLVLIALTFSGYSIYLASISTFKIHSYCIMCLVSYGINFALLFFSDLIRRRFKGAGFFKSLNLDVRYLLGLGWRSGGLMAMFGIGVAAAWISFPPYWELATPPLTANTPTGITEDGHPWIGARDPEVIITEYTDYQCFQCKKMHFFLRQLIASHPGKIKLVHRHFPMDDEVNPLVKEPFHVGSGKLALLAICATEQDKFWQTNDALFQLSKEEELNLHEFSERVDIDASDLARALNDPNTLNKLRADIISALKLEITGTPAFVIDGKAYLSQIPEQVLADVLDQ